MAGPELIAIAGVVATLAGTGVSIQQQQKASAARRKAAKESTTLELEARRKENLLESNKDRLRQRRSAGFGQKTTLLGGDASSVEVQRGTLLGQ